MDLWLVRHGETEWSRTGQHTSRTDLDLLPEGEAQARALGERLRGIRFAAAYSSDRLRARRTAELAGIDVQPTPLLREFDYGDYEGLTSAEIASRHPGWRLYVDGCPRGETPGQVMARAVEFLALLSGVDGPAIAFSHGHFLRALATAWAGIDITTAEHLALDAGAVCLLRADDERRLLQRWNCS